MEVGDQIDTDTKKFCSRDAKKGGSGREEYPVVLERDAHGAAAWFNGHKAKNRNRRSRR